MNYIQTVWIFTGAGSRLSSGVFEDKHSALTWIEKHSLTGVLTRYPLGQGVYEWAIETNLFHPIKEHEMSSDFIQGFTSASQEHYHFEDGLIDEP